MALLWMDGFDTYGSHGQDATDVVSASGYVNVNGLTAENTTRTGRGLCMRMSSGAAVYQGTRCRRAFVTRDEIVIGFAINAPRNDFGCLGNILYDDRMGTIRSQISLWLNGQGGITILRGDNQQFLAASGPNIMFAKVWHYVEVKYKPGSHIIVRLDGATVLTAAGGKHNDAPNSVNMFQFQQLSGEFSLNDWNKRFDDLYICDTTGALFNDFCGDVVIHALTPMQDAGPNQMVAYGGGLSNYTAVDDIPPDGDLSYIYSNTLGQVDMFDLDALPANIIDVLAVSVHARARKDAAGTSNIKLKCRYLSDTATSPPMTLTTVYTNKHHVFETAPDGGGWNRAKANAIHIGVEIA
ncbi:MAG: hypothetical protein M9945_14225 [Aquamicrobium sp.]|uniref:hypothetical protein n=1 Tax=Aquamicrobium sp. TaxID=1872579 RepID=UPI00349E5713|nr:hypothetical protein [Aquamicrobium sp.]